LKSGPPSISKQHPLPHRGTGITSEKHESFYPAQCDEIKWIF